jgi:16S rRNA (cytidine1402-2'-O)-methyltransferase
MRGTRAKDTSTEPTQAATPGQLYVVATPIGNLEDITLRALRILREARWVACEDTRQTEKLLRRHGISARLLSCHEHNEKKRAAELVAALERGEDVALVTDAGTPLVSDPGFLLVRAAIEHRIRVVPVPGASAVLAALGASGIPCEEFVFAGFLPARRGERRRALEHLRAEARTIVLFEAPHRIAGSLADAAEILGERPAAVARELTKVYEEFRRGSLAQLAAQFSEAAPRGEITLIIGPPEKLVPPAPGGPPAASQQASLAERVAELMIAEGLKRNEALKRVARERGLNRREAYRRLLAGRE